MSRSSGVVKLGQSRRVVYSFDLGFRRSCLLQAILIVLSLHTLAQEPLPTVRSESNVVLVPTLVRTKAGEIKYSLQAKDFIIEDNGVQQDVTLDETPEQEPVSLVVAIQVGHKASLLAYSFASL